MTPAKARKNGFSLAAFSSRMREASQGDPSLPSDRNHRAPWLTRLACTAADTGIVALSASFALSLFSADRSQIAGLVFLMAVPLYYSFWEWLIGRSPAKALMGMKMISPRGPVTKGRMILRSALRFVPFLNLVLMLSWRRVTVLDLLSGTRVQVLPLKKTRENEKRKSTPAHPRGYDENLSLR